MSGVGNAQSDALRTIVVGAVAALGGILVSSYLSTCAERAERKAQRRRTRRNQYHSETLSESDHDNFGDALNIDSMSAMFMRAPSASTASVIGSTTRREGKLQHAALRRKPSKLAANQELDSESNDVSSYGECKGFSMEEARLHAEKEEASVRQMPPSEVLSDLQKGNTRFWMGVASRPELSAFERRALISQQFPTVAVLGCADSRVPVEIVFDRGLGECFVVRVAGNALGSATTASLEYSVKHLQVKVIVVMGHEGCGAIKAAAQPLDKIMEEPESLRNVLVDLKNGLDENSYAQIKDPRARDREMVTNNVRYQIDTLRKNEGISARVRTGELILAGAFYEISSGIVDFFYTLDAESI